MLQLMALALAGAMLAAPGQASECLDRPANQITVVPSGLYTEKFDERAPDDFHTFDMRGARWELDMTGDTQAVTVDGPLNGVCIVGVAAQGTQPRDLDWSDVKRTDGVRFVYRDGSTVGRMIAEGLWVDNVGDGFEPARYSAAAGRGYTWTLKSSYFRYVRDDVVENDACHAGEVIDVLVDNSFNFISPGQAVATI